MPLNHRKIAELRERLQLTMEEAAQRAGLDTRQRWYKIESGRHSKIEPDTFYAIARVLGCTMEDLITDAQVKVSTGGAAEHRKRRRGT